MGKVVSIRKNLNIGIENERRIQRVRSIGLGLEVPIDLDYTGATNLLVELGYQLLASVDTNKKVIEMKYDMVFEIMYPYLREATSAEPEKEELIMQLHEEMKAKLQ